MSNSFFDSLADIKEAIDCAGAIPHRFDAIKDYLKDHDLRREFFKLLNDPAWIAILVSRGYFNTPSGTGKARSFKFLVNLVYLRG